MVLRNSDYRQPEMPNQQNDDVQFLSILPLNIAFLTKDATGSDSKHSVIPSTSNGYYFQNEKPLNKRLVLTSSKKPNVTPKAKKNFTQTTPTYRSITRPPHARNALLRTIRARPGCKGSRIQLTSALSISCYSLIAHCGADSNSTRISNTLALLRRATEEP